MTTHLPLELFDCIAEFVSDQQSLLALTRSFPYAPISVNRLFHSIRITHPDTVPKLYRRIRSGLQRDNDNDTSSSSLIKKPFDASDLVHHLSVESWSVDAEVLINLLRLLPNLWSLTLWIGPNNFSPENLEEMFKPPMQRLQYLSLRFRPYVKKATYYQFLKGSYFDSTLLALSAWPRSSKGLPTLSIVQDSFVSDPEHPTPNFAQPIVFFRLDLYISLLVHSSASQNSLTSLRIRVPARSITQPLTVAYLNPTTPNPNADPSPPPLTFLDIATCAVSEGDVEKILLRYTSLQHLVLDACHSLLRSGSPQASGAELDWWAAFGRRLALVGVKRAKEREKQLKEWYETQQRYSLPPDMVEDGEEEQVDEPKRIKRGRRGLATATITLRGSATSPPRVGARRTSPVRVRQAQTSSAGPSRPLEIREEEEDSSQSSQEVSASEDDQEVQRDELPIAAETKSSQARRKGKQSSSTQKKAKALVLLASRPNSQRESKKTLPIPKLHVVPPLPILRSLCLFPFSPPNAPPSSGINSDTQARIRAEFERGWNDGLRVIWEMRGRLGTTFLRNQDVDRNKAKGKGKQDDTPKPKFFMFKDRHGRQGLDDAEEEEQGNMNGGHEGLQEVFPGMEDVFFRSESTSIDRGAPPVLCLAGSGATAVGHVERCGHFVGSEAGMEKL